MAKNKGIVNTFAMKETHELPDFDETTLIRRTQQGDHEAFSPLVENINSLSLIASDPR